MEAESRPKADRWHLILQWLEEHKTEICQAVKGHVRIDYAGEDGLSFEISRRETINGSTNGR